MSPKRITRKQMKRDEFISAVQRLFNLVVRYRKPLAIILAVAMVVTVAVLGWNYYRNQQELKASVLLSAALKEFYAPVIEPGETTSEDETQGPSFPSEEAKYNQALPSFQKVIDSYPRSRSAAQARYYQGVCYIRLNKYEDAIKSLEESVKRSSDRLVKALILKNLAYSYEATGNYQKAAELYRNHLRALSRVVPKELVILDMGKYYEKANQPKEAMAQYQRIIDEFPESPYIDEAQDRLDTLKLTSPEDTPPSSDDNNS